MQRTFAKTDEIKSLFHFLEKDFNFKIQREENLSYASIIEYVGNGRKVSLIFEIKDYYFYFLIFNGEETKYSDKEYGNKFNSVSNLILKYLPEFNIQELQPSLEKGCSEA